jgi:Chromo (CHRromatin Organisation MOdifier) domain
MEVVERDTGSQEEWEVEDVVDSKLFGQKKRLRYKVAWKGYAPDWRYWEEILPGCEELVAAFHTQYPGKPGPPDGYGTEARTKGKVQKQHRAATAK